MRMDSIDWEAVYREYEQKMRSYVSGKVENPADVDDLCGEIFLRVIRAEEAFSGESRAISSYIYMTTRNTVIQYYRKHRQFVEIPETMATDTDIEEQVLYAEMLDLLADALEKLETRLKDIIVLHYYGEKTLKEIAGVMQMSYQNIKVLHKKALGQLKHHLS